MTADTRPAVIAHWNALRTRLDLAMLEQDLLTRALVSRADNIPLTAHNIGLAVDDAIDDSIFSTRQPWPP